MLNNQLLANRQSEAVEEVDMVSERQYETRASERKKKIKQGEALGYVVKINDCMNHPTCNGDEISVSISVQVSCPKSRR